MINPKVHAHYESVLAQANDTSCDEVCEMYLNIALGMAEYGHLNGDLTSVEFQRQTQRYESIRTNRAARRRAMGAAA